MRTCGWCGADISQKRSDARTDRDIARLVPACQPCNSSKGARLLSWWNVSRTLTAMARGLAEQHG